MALFGRCELAVREAGRKDRASSFEDFLAALEIHGSTECRLTAMEFSGRTRANARVWSAATTG